MDSIHSNGFYAVTLQVDGDLAEVEGLWNNAESFVEAVLLQRDNWGVHIVPTVEGSYEGQPPTLPDIIARDRRWAQGNLQHLGIVRARGLTAMGRIHLLMGATSYLISAVWAASLVVGVVLALQGQQLIPSYFIDKRTLFPVWPVVDPGAALRLFFATMLIVLMPKALGLLLEVKRARHTVAALDLKSKSGIHRLITALVERGFPRNPYAANACGSG